ncbi:hypothetical protein [Paenibacillus sp. SAFN-054]|uniref:hypothetical protein n=2 Tax=unclassified Paenibacillus TaxID=185978 RepID=UPI003F810459
MQKHFSNRIQMTEEIMKKTLLALFGTLLFFITAASPMHAEAMLSSQPEPAWEAQAPYLLPADTYVRKVKNKLYVMDGYGVVSIMNDSTGDKIATVDPHTSTFKRAYAGFFGGNQVGNNGNLYLTTQYQDTKNHKLVRKLQAYDSAGKPLWTREFSRPLPVTFAEKVSDISGLNIAGDGTLLFYMSLEKYKFNVFRIDQQGKQIHKKEIKEYVYSYHNDLMTTLLNESGNKSDFSNYKATLTVYDAKLNVQFRQQIAGQKFVGILPDKTLLFYKFNKATTDVIARNSKGTVLWTKSLPGKVFIDNFEQNDSSFHSNVLITSVKNMLYVFNSKGLAAQKTLSLIHKKDNLAFTVNADGNILVVDEKTALPQNTQGQIIILNKDLSTLHKITLSSGSYLETANFYPGQGSWYRWFEDLNNPDLETTVIRKFILNP